MGPWEDRERSLFQSWAKLMMEIAVLMTREGLRFFWSAFTVLSSPPFYLLPWVEVLEYMSLKFIDLWNAYMKKGEKSPKDTSPPPKEKHNPQNVNAWQELLLDLNSKFWIESFAWWVGGKKTFQMKQKLNWKHQKYLESLHCWFSK